MTGWLDTPTDDITGATYADTGRRPGRLPGPRRGIGRGRRRGRLRRRDAHPRPATAARRPACRATRGCASSPGAAVDDPRRRRRSSRSRRSTARRPAGCPAPTSSRATAPRRVVWTADDGDGAFSPNGDGSGDTYRLTGRISEVADWTVRLRGRRTATSSGRRPGPATRSAPPGTDSSAGPPVTDGTYRWRIVVRRRLGQPGRHAERDVPCRYGRPGIRRPGRGRRRGGRTADVQPERRRQRRQIAFPSRSTRPATSTRRSATPAGTSSARSRAGSRPAPGGSSGTAWTMRATSSSNGVYTVTGWRRAT